MISSSQSQTNITKYSPMIITINIKDNQGNEAEEILLSMDQNFDRVKNRLDKVERDSKFCTWCGDIVTGTDPQFCCKDCAEASHMGNLG